MKRKPFGVGRAPLLASAIMVVCAACGTSSSSVTATKPATNPTISRPAQTAGVQSAAVQPSASARMVCAPEGQREIATSIGVEPVQPVVGSWRDQTYTCSYNYGAGHRMVLSVKALPSHAETVSFFNALGTRFGRMPALQGLGQGAFQTKNGSTVVRKDNLVLLVDVTGLPPQFGVPSSPKADISLGVAATIMGCWTGA